MRVAVSAEVVKGAAGEYKEAEEDGEQEEAEVDNLCKKLGVLSIA